MQWTLTCVDLVQLLCIYISFSLHILKETTDVDFEPFDIDTATETCLPPTQQRSDDAIDSTTPNTFNHLAVFPRKAQPREEQRFQRHWFSPSCIKSQETTECTSPNASVAWADEQMLGICHCCYAGNTCPCSGWPANGRTVRGVMTKHVIGEEAVAVPRSELGDDVALSAGEHFVVVFGSESRRSGQVSAKAETRQQVRVVSGLLIVLEPSLCVHLALDARFGRSVCVRDVRCRDVGRHRFDCAFCFAVGIVVARPNASATPLDREVEVHVGVQIMQHGVNAYHHFMDIIMLR